MLRDFDGARIGDTREQPERARGINAAGAQAFSDFMVAPATQAAIGAFGTITYGQALFIPDGGKTEASIGSK